jgi:hypothetical protein
VFEDDLVQLLADADVLAGWTLPERRAGLRGDFALGEPGVLWLEIRGYAGAVVAHWGMQGVGIKLFGKEMENNGS